MTLTINYDIQASMERELDNVVSKYNPDGAWGIAMNPNTGEILAIASRPSFSPSNYSNYSVEEINRNLPIWMTYEPGSTFKIITTASSVEEGTVDLYKDTFYDSGHINVENAKIKCWKDGGHGYETFLNVVENSCNPGFVVMGQKLGKEKLFHYINKFGFGMKTGIDLNGESTGIMFPLERVGPVELATTSFGQGVSVTPIQQITAVSAAINGGNLYKPYIVSSIIDDNSKSVIYENNPLIKRKVISDESSALVRYALESVVSNGTGRNAYIENYRVGGKTGTAQKVNNGKYMHGNYILSFIGFLPADNPEVIVYVAVDNPKGVTQYGGTVSAPIARSLLMSSINILGIEEKDGGMLKEYSYLDTKYLIVPDVVGMSKEEATKMLKEFKVKYSGSGNNVIYMSPKGNTFQSVDTTITLMLN
jgi:stage V sporulation protein D (sporulation-specific penicillin-binding protein)